MMKNLTYHNLMVVIHKLMDKGYSFSESEHLGKNIFEAFTACPQGLSVEERVRRILPKSEWIAQTQQANI